MRHVQEKIVYNLAKHSPVGFLTRNGKTSTERERDSFSKEMSNSSFESFDFLNNLSLLYRMLQKQQHPPTFIYR
jgi:hypothetical protein